MQTEVDTQKNEEDFNLGLKELLKEAHLLETEMDKTDQESEEKMTKLNEKADESIKKIDQLCSDLDSIKNEAGRDMEKIMMEQAEYLASDNK